ncbi:MAG: tetratricopeptide repeat protein [Saprospiraceae bacterium]|nr:tetratricopeptide repeat protein [Saprospiraceae bacterium]
MTYPLALDMLGRVYIIKGDFENAVKAYNTLIKRKPNYFLGLLFFV